MTTVKNKHKHHHNNNDLYEDVEKIKSSLLDATHDVKAKAVELLADSYDDMKDQTTKVKNNVTKYTTKQPFKSLGIATLIGFVIGYFVVRK